MRADHRPAAGVDGPSHVAERRAARLLDLIPGTVLWDFDGTLAHREGMWSGCLVDTLEDVLPGYGHDRESFRPHLRDGFPWHAHHTPHPELTRAYRAAGVEETAAVAAAACVRVAYGDHTRAWALFDDVVPALRGLTATGWRHAILSNHVPELPALVGGLGLDPFVDVADAEAAGIPAILVRRDGAPGLDAVVSRLASPDR